MGRSLAILGVPGVMGGGARIQNMELPQYLLQNEGSVLDGFENVADWTVTKGTAENNATPGEFRTGTQSIKVVSGVGTDGQLDRSCSLTFASAPHARISFYAHDYANLKSILVLFFKSGGNFYQEIQSGSIIRPGWNTFDFVPDAWAITGGLSGTFTGLRVIVRPKTGLQCTVSLDELKIGLVSTPAVLFMTDDGKLSNYSQVYPYMAPRGGRATFYCVTNNIGSEGYCTGAQLQEMGTAGFAIANHTHTHPHLTTLTQEEAEAELTTAKGILDGLGLTGASAHVAYPYGSYNHTTVMAAMAATNMLTGRVTGNRYNYYSYDQPSGDFDYYLHNYLPLTSVVSLATAQAEVDKAISSSRPVAFMTHEILESPTGDNWYIDRFQALVNYIVSKKIPFITIADWWAAKSGPITVPILK